MEMLLKHLLIFVPSVVDIHALMLCYFKHFGDFALSTYLGVHILSQHLNAHSDMHPPHTLKTAIHPLFLQFWCLTSMRGLSCCSLEWHKQKSYVVFFFFFFLLFFGLFFWISHCQGNLNKLIRLIDHTGVYFQEEMWWIVSITFDSRIPTGIFLIFTCLLSFSNFTYCFYIEIQIKYLILMGHSAHHLTPNELVTVLHAIEICLGCSISYTEIRKEN